MRLRNYKETVPYTIEDTLRDVHPHTLEEPFHWAASVFICFFIEPFLNQVLTFLLARWANQSWFLQETNMDSTENGVKAM